MGSPPRGRGKVQSSFLLPDIYGITPAWAGKSGLRRFPCTGHGDHPRVGGEKATAQSGSGSARGSPPRGRGKDDASIAQNTADRITPAWAGKRGCNRAHSGEGRDHPRVGGEKIYVVPEIDIERGSPPRGRGKVDQEKSKEQHELDHPRVGGEKSWNGWLNSCRKGSPPRGRGKAAYGDSHVRGMGITPAWAGKRQRRNREVGALEDHPRVGGEKTMPASPRTPPTGSPPRGRGKGDAIAHIQEKDGITPAWAGKRYTLCRKLTLNGDHPRVGGEKWIKKNRKSNTNWITPAWAGKRAGTAG